MNMQEVRNFVLALDANELQEFADWVKSAAKFTTQITLRKGMPVQFTTRSGNIMQGTIMRINKNTASVSTPQGKWRVGLSLLRKV